ncbi:TPA: universal stress protein [Acinetobacter baumannii]|mgnify:FL=1|jgi:Universal stress protein UspA and related nucleotide-binding proteins|uniref:Universal stress protein family protein n=61 Tax=Pseudomonadota TaxID=1224 RepID=A0A649Z4Z5_PROMI|nr:MULTISPECIES: universal stress protein [Gammaproteobacteria]AEN92361.1 universal stress protein [Acinetobacter baumannii TCDC-AB0715]AHX30327.1 universal stress protein [Acinetobacter baumannii AC12]AHX67140.1 universal stress protein [Acinetobacter baumannii AC30]EMT93500.1 Universal stress protein [Acinetobacter baumannii ABNIH6]EMT95381.1 Universal stress protein [Acinetobacter baumannii ABNIH10]KAE9698552.1 universal stress protein [Enterobacteriaceae bacterium TzEc077]KCW27745.1 univ
MSKIIACIDGSLVTNTVCDYAAWFSDKLNSPIKLLHVIDKPKAKAPQDLSGAIGLGSRETLLKELVELEERKGKIELEHGQILLREAKNYLLEKFSIDAQSFQRHGSVLETIMGMEDDIRVLVMGKHGNETEHDSSKIGTHIENVVRALHKPVLITSAPFSPPKSFLIAFDGSQTARKCVERIASSPLLKGLAVHLVYVGNPNSEMQNQLSWAKEQLESQGFNITSNTLDGEVDKAIINYAEQHQIDLIVVGAYGHSKIRQFFIGSTTTKVITSANKPVLLLR